MAILDDLILQISDATLRNRIQQEIERIRKDKKFGIVFEEHLPECTPLYGIPIKKGMRVAKKYSNISKTFFVMNLDEEVAQCFDLIQDSICELRLEDIVAVATFGEPIYPQLIPVDSIENNPDKELWHTVIEAENYYALQLLEYMYPKLVDCIYIDPPYNNREKDWKYNNDYVDPSDNYRHSKWLSMMKRRLLIAKRILNPRTGVLIVTIDENEVHHLRTLLEELFPETIIQMITAVTQPKGNTRGRFSRVEEYVIYCFMPDAYVIPGNDSLLGEKLTASKPRWKGLLRSGADSRREDNKSSFYPILVDTKNNRVVKGLETLPFPEKPSIGAKIDGYEVAWPIRSDLSEGRWMLSSATLNSLIEKGYVSLGKYDEKRKTWGISYLSEKMRKQIDAGEIVVVSKNETRNVVEIEFASAQRRQIMTVWHRSSHDAGAHGTDLVSKIIGETRAFSFPKSLYSTKDAIAAVMSNNKNAIIVDFFAGSGTTLHAVNLLNVEDGGNRRCIIITNNEVSAAESIELRENGHQPGDKEWESHGICQSVTWPRTKYSILGKREDGSVLNGTYLTKLSQEISVSRSFYQIDFTSDKELNTTARKKQLLSLIGKDRIAQSLVKSDSRFVVSEKHTISVLFDDSAAIEWLDALEDQYHIRDFYIVSQNKKTFNDIKQKIQDLLGDYIEEVPLKIQMSEGFKSNAEYYRLGFLEKNSVELGKQFEAILPILWMQSGSVGKRPKIDIKGVPEIIIPINSNFAILTEESSFATFKREMSNRPEITHVYIITDSQTAFEEMASQIQIPNIRQLYRDYLDNFTLTRGEI